MIKRKISTEHTYLVDMNFWSPLNNGDDDKLDDDKEEINMIKSTAIPNKQISNKWTRRIVRQ